MRAFIMSVVDAFVYRWLEILAGFIFALTIGFIILLGMAYADEKRDFMDECLQHRKQYECVALWRGGGSSAVIPVIVPR